MLILAGGIFMLNVISWIKDIMNKIKDDHVSAYAAQSAFFIILSAVPFLMLLLILLNYVPIKIETLITNINDFFPTDAGNFITAIINEIKTKTSGTVLSITIITLLWTSGKGILALTRGLNSVYGIKESRNYILLRVISTFYTLLLAVMIIFTLGFLVFGNRIYLWICEKVPFLNHVAAFLISIRTISSMAILTALFLIFYKVLPNRKGRLMHQLPGAVFAALGWMISSYIFSIYVDFSSGLSYMYGSLTSIIITMLWLYFCMNIFFFGAELNVLCFPLDRDHYDLRY